MKASALRGIYLRLAGVVMLIVLLALCANAYISHRIFEQSLAPQMSAKVGIIGSSVRALVLKAVEHHIDFKELYGIEQRFDELKQETPEIGYFAITDTDGKVLHERLKAPAGAYAYFKQPKVLAGLKEPKVIPPSVRVDSQYMVSVPIVGANGPLGMLHIGVDVAFVDGIVIDMAYDVGVVLVVALFFTLELLYFLAGERLERSLRALGDALDRGIEGNFSRPAQSSASGDFARVTRLLDGMLERVNKSFEALTVDIDAARASPAHERPPALGAAQKGAQDLSQRFRFGREKSTTGQDDNLIGKVRAPLFVFILAEEMTRSFLPTYVKSLPLPVSWLSSELVVGLPIALFMLIVALAQPHLGAYSERAGHRRTMMIGAGVAALGFITTAFASTVLDLLLWRSLCAFGYAMVFVAGQGFVLENADPLNRTRNFSIFVGAIMVATVCGPSIGGILADNIGVRPTFALSALLALGSMAAMRTMPARGTVDTRRNEARAPSLKEIGALMFNKRFMAVTGLAAMPAKIVLTGICFYLVPLYLLSIGGTQAMTGRLLMSYAVVVVVMGPLTAQLATSRHRMEWLVGGGLMLSGAGGALLLAGGTTLWVFAAVLLIGLGQSMSISAQSALVSEHCSAEVSRMGESAVYGVYRLLERLGNAAGPMLAATLVMAFGYRTSFAVIGAMALLCGAMFLMSTQRPSRVRLVTA
jgi:MFS family permease